MKDMLKTRLKLSLGEPQQIKLSSIKNDKQFKVNNAKTDPLAENEKLPIILRINENEEYVCVSPAEKVSILKQQNNDEKVECYVLQNMTAADAKQMRSFINDLAIYDYTSEKYRLRITEFYNNLDDRRHDCSWVDGNINRFIACLCGLTPTNASRCRVIQQNSPRQILDLLNKGTISLRLCVDISQLSHEEQEKIAANIRKEGKKAKPFSVVKKTAPESIPTIYNINHKLELLLGAVKDKQRTVSIDDALVLMNRCQELVGLADRG